MTLTSGLLRDKIYWRQVLTDSEDGAIVMEVWEWLFGCRPTIVTQRNQNGNIIDAWVNETAA